MELMKEYIRKYGVVYSGNVLKVDSFLNHQLNIDLYKEIGKEFYNLFKDYRINKIVTIEASGIAFALITALNFNVPVVFGKKSKTNNMSNDFYCSNVYSYTHQTNYNILFSKQYLSKDDHVLIIDDFLANGCAIEGLIDIINQANASVEGIGIAIEKGFQDGGKKLRDRGYDVKSLAIIESMDNGIVFK